MLQSEVQKFRGKNFLASIDLEIETKISNGDELNLFSRLVLNSFLYKGTYLAKSVYGLSANNTPIFLSHEWQGPKDYAKYIIDADKVHIDHNSEKSIETCGIGAVCGIGAFVFISKGIILGPSIEIITGKKIYHAEVEHLGNKIKVSDNKKQEILLAKNKDLQICEISLKVNSYLPSITLIKI